MLPKKRTIANTPYEEALNDLRGAMPGLQAIADRAYAVAARTDEEGPRRGIERVATRAVDLITAISGLSHEPSGRAPPTAALARPNENDPRCSHVATYRPGGRCGPIRRGNRIHDSG